MLRVATISEPVPSASDRTTCPSEIGVDRESLLKAFMISGIKFFGTGLAVLTESGIRLPVTGMTAVIILSGRVHSCSA